MVVVFGLLVGFLQDDPAVWKAMLIMGVFLFLISLLQPAIFKAYQEGELLWGTIGEEEDHFVGSAIKMKLIRRPIYIASKEPDEEKQLPC